MPKYRRMKYSQSFLQLLCSCLSLLGKVIKIQQSNLYVTSNFRLWLTILKMGSITFFGGCSHRNRGRSNILFRCTDFNLALAIGHLSCRVLKVWNLSTTSRDHTYWGALLQVTCFYIPGMKLENLLPFLSLNREKVSLQMWTFFEESYWLHFYISSLSLKLEST